MIYHIKHISGSYSKW